MSTQVYEREFTRQVRLSARYLPAIAPFMAVGDIRYYLNGIHVEPHPEGKGVLIVATNGHVIGVIHDADGETNDCWPCPIPKRVIAACKQPRRAGLDAAESVWFLGDTVHVTHPGIDSAEDAGKIGALHVDSVHAPAHDGKFPDWRRCVPRETTHADYLCAQIEYLTLFRSVADLAPGRYSGVVRIHKTGTEHDSYLVRVEGVPEFMGLVMKVRHEEAPAIPPWLGGAT